MTRLVEFRADNWEPVFTYQAAAVTTPTGNHVPLLPVDSPIVLSGHILAVLVSTTVPPGRVWRYGGWVRQRFFSGLQLGGSADSSSIGQHLLLDEVMVLVLEKISADYAVRFSFPRYFKDVNLTMWQYTGVDTDSLTTNVASALAGITFQLDNLHQKVDQLL